MSDKPSFGTLTDAQINEQVALRLGFVLRDEPSSNRAYPRKYRWETKDGEPLLHPGGGFFGFGWCHTPPKLPDWANDDGLAFKELWPKIVDIVSTRELGTPTVGLTHCQGVIQVWGEDYSGNRTVIAEEDSLTLKGDRWSRAISRAFIYCLKCGEELRKTRGQNA